MDNQEIQNAQPEGGDAQQAQQVAIDVLRQQLEKERAKSSELSQRLQEKDLEVNGLKAAQQAARPTAPGPNAARMAIARDKAIQQAGGPARWGVLPLETKLAAQGFASGVSQVDLDKVKALWGPRADAQEAARLHRYNPREYARLRAIWVETR